MSVRFSALKALPVKDLRANPRNVRTTYDDLDELGASMDTQGVLQPLVVPPHGDVWVVLDRHRRLFAARTAGMSVGRITIITMLVAGALAGLAASGQVLGTERSLTVGVAASFGFDAITVALLGRSRPWGTFFAGLLFGALKAGGFLMQSLTQTPIDIVLVVQSLIVLLIAAPPLVRAVFRLPSPTGRPRRPRPARTTTEEVTA